jgi:type II secretory pathway component PulF
MAATYQYKARDDSGKAIQGVMSADSEHAVAIKLRQMGHIPITIEARRESLSFLNFFFVLQRSRVTPSDRNLFTRQLFALQNSGLPILASLSALKQQVTSESFRTILQQAMTDIENGSSLSLALEKFPKVFDPLYVSMIRSGETSGRLPEILERLAILGEHEYKVHRKVKSAMRYPMIVFTAMILGFIFLITQIIPKFAQLYGQFKTNLPLPTRILIGINDVMVHYGWLIVILLVVLFVFTKRLFNTKRGGWLLDEWKLKIPIFGPLILKVILSRFCRITGTLMKSGVPILQILDLGSRGIENRVIAATIEKIKESVNEGKGMSAPMHDSPFFPPVVVQMVLVGENTGRLDELLIHVANYYDDEVDYIIENLTALIEPILILVLGIGVLFMALGIFMPMWSLMNLFRH